MAVHIETQNEDLNVLYIHWDTFWALMTLTIYVGPESIKTQKGNWRNALWEDLIVFSGVVPGKPINIPRVPEKAGPKNTDKYGAV